jgi:hypothetical protein
LRVSFTDEELVAQLAATHDRPEARAGNWFTFFTNLPIPERDRLEALAVAKVGAAPPAAAAPSRPVRHRSKPASQNVDAPPDADKTLKELLSAAKEMTDAARRLAQQMNDLAGRIADASKRRGKHH